MIVNGLNLNDLLTLPARRQHGTFLPVVNVDAFLVKVLIESTAEVANLLILTELQLVLLIVLV